MNKKVNEDLKKIIKDAVQKYAQENKVKIKKFPNIILTTPKNSEHGHLSTNIALQLQNIFKEKSIILANIIVQEIQKKDTGILEKVEIAEPGFINFYLKNNVFFQILNEIMSKKEQYGKSNIGNNKKILIEFVSVNPTGPLHVGHGKCAAVGDALAKILSKAGYQVSTEYYINDHGRQMDILGESVFARYRILSGEDVSFPENGYKGDYITALAKEIIEKNNYRFKGKNNTETIQFFKEYAHKKIITDIKKDLVSFGVEFDNWFSEETLYSDDKVRPVINRLLEEKHIYQQDGALWFKSTACGDEKDRVVVRESGEPTYFASDIAYHEDKYKRGFETLIDIWGADHHGYVKRMKAVIDALGYDIDSFQVLLVQFVTLIKEGKIVGMSTRGGEFVRLKDLISEVGKDVARYFFLMHSHDSHTEFDLDIAKSQSMENPVFYIQYAYARICSIIEKGKNEKIDISEESGIDLDLSLLKSKEEIELIKKLANYRKIIERSAIYWRPYLVASYLHELASIFHKYYTEYKVINPDINLTKSRLYLIHATKIVLKDALKLLGVEAPEKM